MSARLVVVEGLDGAGKNTLTTRLVAELGARGLSVGRLAFPRYGTLHADLAADALHGGQAGAAARPARASSAACRSNANSSAIAWGESAAPAWPPCRASAARSAWRVP